MYGHTTWPPPCGSTGADTGAVPADTGRWAR